MAYTPWWLCDLEPSEEVAAPAASPCGTWAARWTCVCLPSCLACCKKLLNKTVHNQLLKMAGSEAENRDAAVAKRPLWLCDLDPSEEVAAPCSPRARAFTAASPCGTWAAVVTVDGVEVYDVARGKRTAFVTDLWRLWEYKDCVCSAAMAKTDGILYLLVLNCRVIPATLWRFVIDGDGSCTLHSRILCLLDVECTHRMFAVGPFVVLMGYVETDGVERWVVHVEVWLAETWTRLVTARLPSCYLVVGITTDGRRLFVCKDRRAVYALDVYRYSAVPAAAPADYCGKRLLEWWDVYRVFELADGMLLLCGGHDDSTKGFSVWSAGRYNGFVDAWCGHYPSVVDGVGIVTPSTNGVAVYTSRLSRLRLAWLAVCCRVPVRCGIKKLPQ